MVLVPAAVFHQTCSVRCRCFNSACLFSLLNVCKVEIIMWLMKSFRGLCNSRCIEPFFNTEAELLIKPFGTASFCDVFVHEPRGKVRARTCTSARSEGQSDHTRHAAPRANVPTVWVQLVWTGTCARAPSSSLGGGQNHRKLPGTTR